MRSRALILTVAAAALTGQVVAQATITPETRYAEEYNTILSSAENRDVVEVTVSNPGSSAITVETTVQGLNTPQFRTGSSSVGYTLQPGERRTLVVEFDPAGGGYLNVTSTNTDYGLSSKASARVVQRNPDVQNRRTVPGMGLIQLLALGLAATACSALL